MLRLIVVLLIIANGTYYAWTHDMLRDLGWRATSQSEPQRLTQEIDPHRLRVLDKNETIPKAKAVIPKDFGVLGSAAEIAPTKCLQSGAFSAQQREILQQQLKALMPANAWRFDEIKTEPNWLIYMGKYANISTFELKKSELKKMNLAFTTLNEGVLAPGILLGTYPNQAAANQALALLGKRGIRTARVTLNPVENKSYQLFIPETDETMRIKLANLQAHMSGKTLQPCKSKP